MDIFCINLLRSPERKQNMQAQFSRLGLSHIHWIEAVDGKQLSTENLNESCDFEYQENALNRRFLPGEIGCVLSHQKAYQQIIAKKIPSALILEDDTILSDDMQTNLQSLAHAIADDKPQLVLLSRIRSFYSTSRKQLPGFELVEMASGRGALGYVVNNHAAKVLLATNRPIRYVADDWKRAWYFSGKKLMASATLPPLVAIDEQVDSDILFNEQEKNKKEIRKKRVTLKANVINVPLKFQLWMHRFFRRTEKYRS